MGIKGRSIENWVQRTLLLAGVLTFAFRQGGCATTSGAKSLDKSKCTPTPPAEGEPPWFSRADRSCAQVDGADGSRVSVTFEGIERFSPDGTLIWTQRLGSCDGISGVALGPKDEVAVTCANHYLLFDASGGKLIDDSGNLFFSAPLFANDLIFVARGFFLQANKRDGSSAFCVALTDYHPSPKVPALAVDQDGNILVYLYTVAEEEAREQSNGHFVFTVSAAFAPALFFVNAQGDIVKRLRRDAPDFAWPRVQPTTP